MFIGVKTIRGEFVTLVTAKSQKGCVITLFTAKYREYVLQKLQIAFSLTTITKKCNFYVTLVTANQTKDPF